MGIIKLKNIRIFSYHGCLIEESKIGSHYRVDLEVQTDLKKSAASDELTDTADYVLLNRIVAEEMAIRSKLIEHVGQRIFNRIKKEVQNVDKLKIKVVKICPPINGDVENVAIIIEE